MILHAYLQLTAHGDKYRETKGAPRCCLTKEWWLGNTVVF